MRTIAVENHRQRRRAGPSIHPNNDSRPLMSRPRMGTPFKPQKITLAEWDRRYAEQQAAGLKQPDYGGPLSRHVDDGD